MKTNKHLRMLWGIVSHPFKARRNYRNLERLANERAEIKAYERRMYMNLICGRAAL